MGFVSRGEGLRSACCVTQKCSGIWVPECCCRRRGLFESKQVLQLAPRPPTPSQSNTNATTKNNGHPPNPPKRTPIPNLPLRLPTSSTTLQNLPSRTPTAPGQPHHPHRRPPPLLLNTPSNPPRNNRPQFLQQNPHPLPSLVPRPPTLSPQIHQNPQTPLRLLRTILWRSRDDMF